MRRIMTAGAAVIVCLSLALTPAMAREPSPAPSRLDGVTVEPLFAFTLGEDALPAELSGVLVFRKVYPADQEISYTASFIPPNSFVRYVESGQLGLRPHGDMTVIRGGVTPPTVETVSAGSDAIVSPGDTFVMTDLPYDEYGKDALGTMWHEGADDATVVGFAIRESGRCCAMTHSGMLSPWHATLSGDELEAMIGHPVTFRMDKLHLEPGATLPLVADESPTMRLVDAGAVTATILGKDGAEERSMTFATGQSFADSMFPAGTASVLGNAGSEPVVLLQLVIEPAAPDAASLGPTGASPSPAPPK